MVIDIMNLTKVAPKKVGMHDLVKNLLFKAVGMWLITDEMDTIFNGSEEQVKALSHAMMATKDFYTYLRSDQDLDVEVMNALLLRKIESAQEFEKAFDAVWPF